MLKFNSQLTTRLSSFKFYFLTNEIPLRIMKTDFYLSSEEIFVVKIFRFFNLFMYWVKWLDKEHLKIRDVTA